MYALLPVGNVLGRLLAFFSLAYLLPIACSLLCRDGITEDFVLAGLITLALGLALFAATRGHYRELKTRDGFLLVTLAWLLMAGIGTIPLLIVYPQLGFTHAFFETMSAMTTTGGTVLVGLDTAHASVNLWRHELQWIGGMGIIVLAVAVLPLLGVGGMQLFRAETAGPMKDAKLTSRIADTAKALYLIYVALTLACLVSLRLAGMSWFDALCHAFSALSLGGFSTRDASIGQFDSPAIEGVLVVFMVLGGINFATHFLAWRWRSLRCYFRDAEARAFVSLVGASVAAIAAILFLQGIYADLPTALRHAAFNVVSIATTTGYASVDYERWPPALPLWMLLLCAISASSGSTGGGIKMVRTLTLWHHGRRELHQMLHPRLVEITKLGAMPVPNRVTFAVLGFICLYGALVIAMTLLMLLTGMDVTSAITAVVACITNTGPGLGAVGPSHNYASLSDLQLWLLSATMLLGRLEIMSVVVLFTPGFWKR